MDNLPPDYREQEKRNREQLDTLLKAGRPDIHLLMQTLDDTRINWRVIWKVIYAMNNIATDTKYGTVSILIEDNIVRFVRGEHADKLNEPVYEPVKIET